MACLLTGGYLNECKATMGGIDTLYIANYEHVTSITDAAIDGVLDAITMVSPNVFFKVEGITDTISYTEESQGASQAGYYNQSIAFQLSGTTPAAIKFANEIKFGKFILISEGRNGERRVFGLGRGLKSTVNTNTSGAALGDPQSVSITLSGAEIMPAPHLATSAVVPV